MAIKTNAKILSVPEAAIELGLSVHTVRKYVQRKLIKPLATVGGVHLITLDECQRYNREKAHPGNPTFVRKPTSSKKRR